MSNRLFENLHKTGALYPKMLADPVKLSQFLAVSRAGLPNWTERDHRMAAAEIAFGWHWNNSGQIVYNLTHSLAAMLAITSAPPLDWSYAPHAAFILKVPRAFLPLEGTIEPEYSYIFASQEETLLVADYDTTATLLVQYPKTVSAQALEMTNRDTLSKNARKVEKRYSEMEKDDISANVLPAIAEKARQLLGKDLPAPVLQRLAEEAVKFKRAETAEMAHEMATADDRTMGLSVLVSRFISNVIAYVTEHRLSTSSVSAAKPGSLPLYCTLTVPPEIVVDRAFRDAARDAVDSTVAGSVIGIRRMLAHYVRGHWRNQAHGPSHSQRSLKWIAPHRRGNESLGSVIRRVEHLDIPAKGN